MRTRTFLSLKRCSAILSSVLYFGVVGQAQAGGSAGDRSPLSETISIQLGAFYTQNRSGIRVDDSKLKFGTDLNFENALGIEDQNVFPSLSLYWRVSQRWRLDFEYLRSHRSGERRLTSSVDWADLNFPVGVNVTTHSKQDIFRFGAGYAFYRTEKSELGVSLGVHWTQLQAAISGQASVAASALTFRSDTRSLPIPLPVLGLYGTLALNSRWILRGRFDYTDLSLALSEWQIGGRALNAEASIEYALTNSIGIGLGYRHIDVAVGAEYSGLRGVARYQMSGPFAFTRASF